MSRWHGWLRLASRLLEAGNLCAFTAYRFRICQTTRVEVPVISVGNIAMGGTGKTPLVAALVRTLSAAGARPAILTRGYRRRQREPLMIVNDPLVRWEQVGDEPALLARALPGVPIVVDANRVRGARRAIASFSPSHLILDDGFQHWALARDLDVVALPAQDPFCTRSPRRESPRALARADALVITHAEEARVSSVALQLQRQFPGKPVYAVRIAATSLHQGERLLPPESLAGKRVLAVAGLAQPERFFATLKKIGADLVRAVPLPDHHAYTCSQIEQLLTAAENAQARLVTTAKDAVKFPTSALERVFWLEVEAVAVLGSLAELLLPVLRFVPSAT